MKSLAYTTMYFVSSLLSVQAIEIARLWGSAGIKMEVLQELEEQIAMTKDRCAFDVEIYCSTHKYLSPIFLSFGNGIVDTMTATPPYSHSETSTLLFDSGMSMITIYETVNRRLSCGGETTEADSIDRALEEESDFYPHPFFGFGEKQDQCLEAILNGENPNGPLPLYSQLLLSRMCRESAESVSNFYADLGTFIEYNEFVEWQLRAVLFLCFLSLVFLFHVENEADSENDECIGSESDVGKGFEYVELVDKDESDHESAFVGVPISSQ